MKHEMIDVKGLGVWKFEQEEMVQGSSGEYLRKARWVYLGGSQPQRIPEVAMQAFLDAQRGFLG